MQQDIKTLFHIHKQTYSIFAALSDLVPFDTNLKNLVEKI